MADFESDPVFLTRKYFQKLSPRYDRLITYAVPHRILDMINVPSRRLQTSLRLTNKEVGLVCSEGLTVF